MNRLQKRAYSLLEIVVVMSMMILLLALVVPRNSSNEDTLTTKGSAEELVARLRRARQNAITKAIPTAIAIPNTPALSFSDTVYQLEGEVEPDPSLVWRISQKDYETVFFTGEWAGPNWEVGPRMGTSARLFDLSKWSSKPIPAALFVFTPAGDVVSNMRAADGEYRILVANGLNASGKTLVAAGSPWTVSITPSGESNLQQGVYKGASILTPSSSSSPLGATFNAPGAETNQAPSLVSVKALPDFTNPKSSNRELDRDSLLTLEVRVTDANGDPPYFEWYCNEVKDADGNTQTDMDLWGGRFSNDGECRMEWDPEQGNWVGRASWVPAKADPGGSLYKLKCKVRDRNGGSLNTGFPVAGWLETTKKEWVLYRTLNIAGQWELWKMTLEGEEHTRVAGFPYQSVLYGNWSASGEEVVLGAPDGIYRALNDGSDLRRITPNGLGDINGVAMSPSGEAVYYVGGGRENKKIRKVTLNAAGAEVDSLVFSHSGAVDWIYDLCIIDLSGNLLVTQSFYRKYSTLFNTKHRHGLMVVNLDTGQESGAGKKTGAWGEPQDRGTSFGSFSFQVESGETLATWGTKSGVLKVYKVTYPGPNPENIVLSGAGLPFNGVYNTGLGGDVHHPRPTYKDDGSLKGLVFSRGRDAASTLWHMEDINNPSVVRQIPLSPVNRGGMDVAVTRPI